MIRTYRYVSHSMEKMQEFIDYIFLDVWCRAPEGLTFGGDLFKQNTDLYDVISDFGFSGTAPERGKLFYENIKEIYALFEPLNSTEIGELKNWYSANNQIEKICNNIQQNHIRYSDLHNRHPDLSDRLKEFFMGLYSGNLLGLAKLREKIGDIDDHYNELMETNQRPSKCPVCGMVDILSKHSKREAYDHYLPKSIYPFNSINFRNLVPTCYCCNSSYKGPKDPIDEHTPKRVFHPYTTPSDNIEVSVFFDPFIGDNIPEESVHISYGPASIEDEISTWRSLYGIDERYRTKLSGPDAKDWLEQSRMLRNKYKISIAEQIDDQQEATTKDSLANSNFLKLAFLEGCERANLV